MNQNITRTDLVDYPNSHYMKDSIGQNYPARSLHPDDTVHLVFVTPHNFMWGMYMRRQQASDLIRDWYEVRDRVMKGEAKEEWITWLKKGTFAMNERSVEEGKTFAAWAIGMEHVIAMYIREFDIPPGEVSLEDLQKKYYQKITEAMDQHVKDMKQGDEWRGEDEPE